MHWSGVGWLTKKVAKLQAYISLRIPSHTYTYPGMSARFLLKFRRSCWIIAYNG
jgi:hypothetical protein